MTTKYSRHGYTQVRHLVELWNVQPHDVAVRTKESVDALLDWVAHMEGAELQEVLVELPTIPGGPNMRVSGTWLVPDTSWDSHLEEWASRCGSPSRGGVSGPRTPSSTRALQTLSVDRPQT